MDSSQAPLEFLNAVDRGHDDPVSSLDGLFYDRFVNSRFPIKDDSNIGRDYWKLVIVAEFDDSLIWQEFID